MPPLSKAAAPPPHSKTVTLDVKDADLREVLQSLKTQCGIKNMIIDRDVEGRATFYFHDVPCETAFRVVFRTFNLSAVSQ